MEKIEKKINGFLSIAIGSMAAMILLGLVFVILPAFTLSVMRWGIAILLIAAGVALIARDMSRDGFFSLFSTSLVGIFFVLMGIVIALYPQTINIVTIAFGVYMILNSFMQISLASRIRNTSAYPVALITNLIGLICGVIMIVRPGDSNEVIIMIAGVLLMIYGISGLIDTFILKSKIDTVKDNVKTAEKTAKKLIENAEEAEVVEEKKTKKAKKSK